MSARSGEPGGVAWETRAWRIGFGRQDVPGTEARLLAMQGGAVLFEHGGTRRTRARELTTDGRAPRRSGPLGDALRGAVACGDRFVLLMDGRAGVFDPATFELAAVLDVDPLTSELCASPRGTHVYAGHQGLVTFCQVVDLAGRTRVWPGLAPPTAVLPALGEPLRELWLRRGEARVRIVEVDGGEVRVVGAFDVADFSRADATYAVNGVACAVLGATARPGLPFPSPTDPARRLARLEIAPGGVTLERSAPPSGIDDVLGTDLTGRLVALGYAGKPYVALVAPDTMRIVGRRAFAQAGDYRLAALVDGVRVLVLRRYEKLDRVCVTTWCEQAGEAPRVADARVTEMS